MVQALSGYDHRRDEFEIARAITGISRWGEVTNQGLMGRAVEALRANLLPVLCVSKTWQWNETSRSVVWTRGASLFENLISVLRRRLIDAKNGQGDGLPLWSGYGARFSDLLALRNREVDEERLSDLIHALALIDTGVWSEERIERKQWETDPTPDLHSSSVWFDADDRAHTDFVMPTWHGRPLLDDGEVRCAFELPRAWWATAGSPNRKRNRRSQRR
jgi:CRISPR-associated protein Csx17